MASSTNGFNSRNCHAKGGRYDGGTIDDGFYFFVWNERVSNMVVVSINVRREHRFRQMKGLSKTEIITAKN